MREAPGKGSVIQKIGQARRDISPDEMASYRSEGFLVVRRLVSPETENAGKRDGH